MIKPVVALTIRNSNKDLSIGTSNGIGNIHLDFTVSKHFANQDVGSHGILNFRYIKTVGQEDMDGRLATNECQQYLNALGIDCPELIAEVQRSVIEHYNKPQYKK